MYSTMSRQHLAGLSIQVSIVSLDLGHLSGASAFPPPPLSLQPTHALKLPLSQLSSPLHLCMHVLHESHAATWCCAHVHKVTHARTHAPSSSCDLIVTLLRSLLLCILGEGGRREGKFLLLLCWYVHTQESATEPAACRSTRCISKWTARVC